MGPKAGGVFAPNPMLLVFLDLSIEEIDILCRVPTEPPAEFTPEDGRTSESGWLASLLASRK
ncbi:MAG: hypothetical protein ABS59_11310 [Methylobacterium sp. SCN 67-24]|jgi:hypothetical protein|nr:MAG: hypothetical protein ABS59_11310 [Methylobacterium sp. SCN 67-24]